MFRPEEVQQRLREKPFRPFRIIASEGLRYDIYYPDLVLVGSRDLMIGFSAPNRPTIYDQVTRVALVHVVALEDITQPPTPSTPSP
jgi:hypothetical protein